MSHQSPHPFAALQVVFLGTVLLLGCTGGERAADIPTADDGLETVHGDRMIRSYFADQVRRIEDRWTERATDLVDWRARRPERVRRLREMLGLLPWPERGPLEVNVTDTLEGPGFEVEKLHFQSIPGLYVTANLYRPASVEEELPAVLYVTGHASEYDEDGERLGSKTAYQRHPAWYARHGYVSLVFDTIQLGEIDGVHHGTYRRGRWWWFNRGYTPLGVEVWNSMRALDLLAERPEVDESRMAVTGRSGGGAYSWFLPAIDDRVVASVPTAGITDLRNYLLDEVLADHCDCMYMTNTYRWDFTTVAALSAPRPTLLVNGDRDPLFPLDGVRRVYQKARQVWALYDRAPLFDLFVAPAAHEDTPPIQRAAFEFLHRHLKNQVLEAPDTVEAYFDPVRLRVLEETPEDAINDSIDELFIPPAEAPDVPGSQAAWRTLEDRWLSELRGRTFRGWPSESETPSIDPVPVDTARTGDLILRTYRMASEDSISLRLWVLAEENAEIDRVRLSVVDSVGWRRWTGVLRGGFGDLDAETAVGPGAGAFPWPAPNESEFAEIEERMRAGDTALAVFAPRGVGPTRWTQDRPGWEIRRGFTLLGQTRDGMRVWDVRRAIRALDRETGATVDLEARSTTAGVVLYAGLFEASAARLVLEDVPSTHRNGPFLLNVRTVLDLPQTAGLAVGAGRDLVIRSEETDAWSWAERLARRSWIDGSVSVRAGGEGPITWIGGEAGGE